LRGGEEKTERLGKADAQLNFKRDEGRSNREA
jgi:hypothetical protein